MPARTHGHSAGKTPEYRAWSNMLSRCRNPNTPRFDCYGGRGIKVCKRWERSFIAFLADVGFRPSTRHSLDRIKNDRGYFPGNVRWATRAEQLANRRNSLIVLVDGKRLPAKEAASLIGMSYRTIRRRVKSGLPIVRLRNVSSR